jgi:hypothetical protein
MPAQFTLPPDTRAVGTGNPPADMNALIDAATAMGAVLNVLNAAYSGGADPTGVADSTAAIQAALNAAGKGQIVTLPAGTYSTTSPLTIPAGVVLRGASGPVAAYWGADSGTTIKPTAGFSGTSVLSMSDVGSAVTQGPSVMDLAIDGSLMTTGTTDGIRVTGPVVEVYLHNVSISGMKGWGINTIIDAGVGTGNQYPYEWHVSKLFVETCATGGVNLNYMTDATWADAYVLACGSAAGPGWVIAEAGNSHFTNCRAEWSGTYGFRLTGAWTTGTGAGGFEMTGCSTDRNGFDGLKIDATGTAPVTISNFTARRDGYNAGSGGGSYSGVSVASAGIPVVMTGLTVYPGVNDDGTGVNCPQFGVSIASSLATIIDSGYIQGATTALNVGTGNTYWWTGPGVVTATGTTASPANTTGPAYQAVAPYSGELLTAGEAVQHRVAFTQQQPLTTGTMFLTYWTAARTETAAHVVTTTGGTAASGLTYANIGFFTVAANGDLTLVASTGDLHTTLWIATFTDYDSSLGAGFTKVAGTRYALGLLAVGTTPPNLWGQFVSYAGTAPIIAGTAAEATLPATLAHGSITANTYQIAFQAVVKP